MSEAASGKSRRLAVLVPLVTIVFVILCGLGVWQLQRLAWKNDLITTVESRTALAPVAAPGPAEWPRLDYDAVDYLPVALVGAFHNDLEAHVYASLSDPIGGPIGGQGYFVLTPFQTVDGWWVIVNRGFVPTERKDPATRSGGQTEGLTEITGLLRQPQGRNAFTPPDDVAGNVWFTRDPAAIAEARGLPGALLAPYYIDARFDPSLPGGLPQGGETVVSFPNNHLQYVITWFGLALALLGVFFGWLRSTRRRTRLSPPGSAG
jgi:surfeit locus 1 family protein